MVFRLYAPANDVHDKDGGSNGAEADPKFHIDSQHDTSLLIRARRNGGYRLS